ncbi:MAG: DNA-3-methyladenine glycosylase [Acidobacteria bacterium]|nr:DNA-3-methyladenine glycosylase [Acidobacteriota bacterium]
MKRTTAFLAQLKAAERALSRRDERLRNLIKRHRPCQISPHNRYFETLIEAVISQQLSTKVADTIYGRFKALYAPARFPKPEQILDTADEVLRATGMSNAKVSFVKDLVAKTGDGTISFNRLSRMSDEQVIEMFTQVKGIGVWTAQMFLIFSLGRLNVLPSGDLGIRKAIQITYGLDDLPGTKEIEKIADENQWKPYCSVASWFLWRSLRKDE